MIHTAEELDGQKLLSCRSRLNRHAKCGSLLRSVIGSLDRGGGGRYDAGILPSGRRMTRLAL